MKFFKKLLKALRWKEIVCNEGGFIASSTAAAIGGIGSAVGGVAGAVGKSTSSSTQAGQRTLLDLFAGETSFKQLEQLREIVGAGPGASDVRAGLQAQRDLAEQLKGLSETGGLPTAQDISATSGIAGNLFQSQRVGLQQAFEDEATRTAQLAARLGRSADDPILQAKLGASRLREESLLGARQGELAQRLALALPGQRLGFASQRANVLSGLGQQAQQNRLSLLGAGLQARGVEAGTLGQVTTGQSGGGIGDALSGAFTGLVGGAGAGFSFDKASAENERLGKIFGSPTGTQFGQTSGGTSFELGPSGGGLGQGLSFFNK